MPDQDARQAAPHEDALRELAAAYGVAVDYWDWQGRHVLVATETLVAVLAALDVDAGTAETAQAALVTRQDEAWRRMLPPVLVTRDGRRTSFALHVPAGRSVHLTVRLETGELREGVEQHESQHPPREIDGVLVREMTGVLPGDLPLGYHEVYARSSDQPSDQLGDVGRWMALVVTPQRVGLPARLGERPHWGLAAQLYSARTAASWGTGDLVDLEDLGAAVAVDHRAAYVLVNPLHAAEPGAPMEPSPYLPTSRRYVNPLYIRPERIPEHADLSPDERARVEALRHEAVVANAERVDRDRAWAAKREALRMIFAVERTMGRRCAFGAYELGEGNTLTDYATWAAIAEVHGPDWTAWPPGLQHPELPDVAAFRRAHPDEVEFQRWLQWVVDEQLAHTQLGLRRAGMGLGVMTDLAVGVNPRGADAWLMQETYAAGVHVGAPPDPYNQNGQDWSQPPWRPDRLAEAAYEPFRRVVQAALRSAGGLRVDHVIGLFRLWWIPRGAGPTAGTYVRYDHEAMIGILALEAVRADAVVVGEDLGTVEPWVRDYLAERGILGTSILWFERDHRDAGGDGGPLRAERWRTACLASVTTHDLPPTAGYLAGDHVRLRDSLGLLTRPVEEELRVDAADREAWLGELRRAGLLSDGRPLGQPLDQPPEPPPVQETVEALHAYLSRTPSRLRCLALTDAAGDRRAQNQPGTVDEYPNWRVPLSGPDGRPVLVEDVIRSDRAQRLFRIMDGAPADLDQRAVTILPTTSPSEMRPPPAAGAE